jgi:hypothetical protein
MTNDEIGNTTRIEFITSHQPALQTGDYTIKVEQQLVLEKTSYLFEKQQNFSVLGPRFSINPQEIRAVFPPPGSLGSHTDALPHLTFKRTTLPWERSGVSTAGENGDEPAVSWLALLLFDEQDFQDRPAQEFEAIKNPQTVKLGQILCDMNEADTASALLVHKEAADQEDDDITVIDVPLAILKKTLPSTKELKLLAHVRRPTDENGELTGDEAAVILCKRLPQANSTSIVHLVSVEGRFGDEDFNPQGMDPVRLVSLFSWRFACNQQEQTFKGLLHGLDHRTLRLRALENQELQVNQSIESYYSMGCVPLPHRMRQGNQTLSWYHGPFIPGSQPGNAVRLPAQSADRLVRYDPNIGMFDESYAAAWQLGRLLAVQNRPISIDLFNWNQSHARGQQAQPAENEILRTLIQSASPPSIDQKPPKTVEIWLNDLAQLKGIPFNYLVPDERLLPPEAIRFFQVDPEWVACLLDGACSIGRVLSADCKQDGRLNGFLPRDTEKMSGVLLRSDLVSGWPGLLMDGYSDHEGKRRLALTRMDRLSRNVLICLFRGEGPVESVDIYQKPETLHFGSITMTDPIENLKPENAAEFACRMVNRSIEKVRFCSKDG